MISLGGAALNSPYLAAEPDNGFVLAAPPQAAVAVPPPVTAPPPAQFQINTVALGLKTINIGSGYWLTINEFAGTLLFENSLTNFKTTITKEAKILAGQAALLPVVPFVAPPPIAPPVAVPPPVEVQPLVQADTAALNTLPTLFSVADLIPTPVLTPAAVPVTGPIAAPAIVNEPVLQLPIDLGPVAPIALPSAPLVQAETVTPAAAVPIAEPAAPLVMASPLANMSPVLEQAQVTLEPVIDTPSVAAAEPSSPVAAAVSAINEPAPVMEAAPALVAANLALVETASLASSSAETATTLTIDTPATIPSFEASAAPASVVSLLNAAAEPPLPETTAAAVALLAILPLPVPPLPPPAEEPSRWLQFWGTTSFAFGDDGMITLQTKPSDNAPGNYELDVVTVTNGDRGVVITGLADQVVENLHYDQSTPGRDLEDNVRDGLVIVENAHGTGWIGADDEVFNQDLLNQTAIGGDYEPGSDTLSTPEIRKVVMMSLANMQMSMQMGFIFARTISDLSESQRDVSSSHERRRGEQILLDHILAQRHVDKHCYPNRF